MDAISLHIFSISGDFNIILYVGPGGTTTPGGTTSPATSTKPFTTTKPAAPSMNYLYYELFIMIILFQYE